MSIEYDLTPNDEAAIKAIDDKIDELLRMKADVYLRSRIRCVFDNNDITKEVLDAYTDLGLIPPNPGTIC